MNQTMHAHACRQEEQSLVASGLILIGLIVLLLMPGWLLIGGIALLMLPTLRL